jgi:hypothetical protein
VERADDDAEVVAVVVATTLLALLARGPLVGPGAARPLELLLCAVSDDDDDADDGGSRDDIDGVFGTALDSLADAAEAAAAVAIAANASFGLPTAVTNADVCGETLSVGRWPAGADWADGADDADDDNDKEGGGRGGGMGGAARGADKGNDDDTDDDDVCVCAGSSSAVTGTLFSLESREASPSLDLTWRREEAKEQIGWV